MEDPLSLSRSQLDNNTEIDAQHRCGKLTARERIGVLLDQNSFQDFDKDATQQMNIVTGSGTIHGCPVFVFAKDFTVSSGAMSSAHAAKIAALQQQAIAAQAPLIGLLDSDGMELDGGLDALTGYAEIARLHVQASGLIPQISVIMGPCVGGDAFLAAMTDFIFMVEDTSSLFVTGPEIANRLTGLNQTSETLGGAMLHASASGLADGVYPDEILALSELRRFIDFLPPSHQSPATSWPSFDKPDRDELSLDSLLPDEPAASYDVKELILKIVDEGDFFELQAAFAANIVIGFGRMDGRTIGFIANQPLVLGGVLDADAARKAARFIRFCDCFNLPIVTLVDAPGFLPGARQEEKPLAAQGAKLIFAYVEAAIPKVAIVLGQAYGAAYAMLASKHVCSDRVLAWPTARLGIRNDVCVPIETALEQGDVDEIIAPHATRAHILRALSSLSEKPVESLQKKHNNMPL